MCQQPRGQETVEFVGFSGLFRSGVYQNLPRNCLSWTRRGGFRWKRTWRRGAAKGEGRKAKVEGRRACFQNAVPGLSTGGAIEVSPRREPWESRAEEKAPAGATEKPRIKSKSIALPGLVIQHHPPTARAVG